MAENPPRVSGSHVPSTGNRSPFPRSTTSSVHMACLRRRYEDAGVSESAARLLLSSWRPSTSRHYDSAWGIWERWCSDHHRNPVSPTIGAMVNFWAEMFHRGQEYRSLNCYRSAFSSVLEPIGGFPVGQHPLVCQLLKGAFQLRPPPPKYSEFWSVDQVLSHICSWGPNSSLPLQKLSWKLAMLMALCSASRSSDLCHLSVNHMQHFPSRTVFLPMGLAKQSRPTHLPKEIAFAKFEDPILCPIACLQQYLSVITAFRSSSEEGFNPNLSISRPHCPVVPSTIGRWQKSVLSSAGVDTSIFKTHSTRGASSSKATMDGVTLQTILSTADCSSAGTFKKFYCRKESRVQSRQEYSTAVLNTSTSNSRCDMEPEPSDMQF